jgi:hypothetical protein
MIPRGLVERIVTIVIGIFIHCDPLNVGDKYITQLSPVLQRCWQYVTHYKPCFHPSIYLEQEIWSVYESWKKLETGLVTRAEAFLKKENTSTTNVLEEHVRQLVTKLSDKFIQKYGLQPLFGVEVGDREVTTFALPCSMPVTSKELARIPVSY